MKTVKPIDENELMELMAGKQPAPAPAINSISSFSSIGFTVFISLGFIE